MSYVRTCISGSMHARRVTQRRGMHLLELAAPARRPCHAACKIKPVRVCVRAWEQGAPYVAVDGVIGAYGAYPSATRPRDTSPIAHCLHPHARPDTSVRYYSSSSLTRTHSTACLASCALLLLSTLSCLPAPIQPTTVASCCVHSYLASCREWLVLIY